MRKIIFVIIALVLLGMGAVAAHGGKLRIILPSEGCRISVDNQHIYAADRRRITLTVDPGYHNVIIRDEGDGLIYKDRISVDANKATVVKVPRVKKK